MTHDKSKAEIEKILETFANTIALGIMGNVPGAEGTPVYTNPDTAANKLQSLITAAEQRGKAEALQEANRQFEIALEVPDYYSDRVSKFRQDARQKWYAAQERGK